MSCGRRFCQKSPARTRRENRQAHIWSAGCASGEEPYTLRILWDLEVASSCPGATLSILATDIDEGMLTRARRGCFKPTSLRELPTSLRNDAFEASGRLFWVKPAHRQGIVFQLQDLRKEALAAHFDLIMCCNVAFTYFAPELQRQVLTRLLDTLLPNGFLVVGSHESLPDGFDALVPLAASPQIFRKAAAG